MAEKKFISLMLIIVSLLGMTILFSHFSHQEYQRLSALHDKTLSEGKKLTLLRKRWSDKRHIKRFISDLKKITDEATFTTQGGVQHFSFADLTAEQMDTILNLLYHNFVKIKKMQISYNPGKSHFRLSFTLDLST